MMEDPVTGDKLTRLEYYTRQVQVLVRTPWFIFVFVVGTVLIWLTNNPTLLLWWNLCASALAIIIEWLVGTYMFGQTGRDAVHIRRIAKIDERMERMEVEHGKTLLEIKEAVTKNERS
jgi:hypothetical protein